MFKKFPTILFPAVSNGERVEKLRVVVEGAITRMRDFLLPRNTANASHLFVTFSFGSRRQNAWSSNTASSFVRNLFSRPKIGYFLDRPHRLCIT
jgi:hypothetical protein